MFKLLIFLLVMGCSHELKYRYTSSKRYLASLTHEEVRVHRVKLSLREKTIFASGMDSTYLIAELFDQEGHLLTNVDPSDLTLSTNVDIEAKPFTLKKGVYKAEILPRVKSPDIKMRVDWQGRILSSEIILKTSITPLKDKLLPVFHDYLESRSMGEISVGRGSSTPEGATESFAVENLGDNQIVDATRNPNSMRNYNFNYLEQARQNLAMEIDDAPNGTISHTMHSLFMFFPRKRLPLVQQLSGTINVTLPTGEKVIFQKDSKEIVDGVFQEGPVDVSRDRFKRSFADLKYQGKGVVLRANARGQSPQLGQYENTKIDMEYGLTGSMEVLIINGSTNQRCRRPKSDFWEPLDVSPIEFKFATDEEFEKYLLSHCGFGLPKL
jgi:hypothetical protein